MAIGLVNLLGRFLGMALIDKPDRKTLLLIGALGMVLALGGVATISYTDQQEALLVWCLVMFITFFAVSQGEVIWVYISEAPRRACVPRSRVSALPVLGDECSDRADLPVHR